MGQRPVAYDRIGDDGVYFDVYVMALDGRGTRALVREGRLVPQKNNGNPSWHPSGNYIVFQSEVAASQRRLASDPGKGVNNVLWVTDPSGQSFTQLAGHWRSRSPTSSCLAGGPPYGTSGSSRRASRARTRTTSSRPTAPSSSSQQRRAARLAAADQQRHLPRDLMTLALTRLTDTTTTSTPILPDGRKIVWMSNQQGEPRHGPLDHEPDGSGKERLTFLNQGGCPEYADKRAVIADNAVNSAGDQILIDVHDQPFSATSSIMRAQLDRSLARRAGYRPTVADRAGAGEEPAQEEHHRRVEDELGIE